MIFLYITILQIYVKKYYYIIIQLRPTYFVAFPIVYEDILLYHKSLWRKKPNFRRKHYEKVINKSVKTLESSDYHNTLAPSTPCCGVFSFDSVLLKSVREELGFSKYFYYIVVLNIV